MPLLTSKEMANDLGISVEQIYALASKMPGFFPVGKYHKHGNRTGYLPSLYTAWQHQLLGRTLEMAPGSSVDDKIENIFNGYQLSMEDKNMLYQSAQASEQVVTLASKLNDMLETLKSAVNSPRLSRKITELSSEFDGLTPDECRKLAQKMRVMNPENAYLLARRRDEDDAFQNYISSVDEKSGVKVSGNKIIDSVCEHRPYLGQELRRKGAAWRRFRSRLIGSGKFKEPNKGGAGYLVTTKLAKGS